MHYFNRCSNLKKCRPLYSACFCGVDASRLFRRDYFEIVTQNTINRTQKVSENVVLLLGLLVVASAYQPAIL